MKDEKTGGIFIKRKPESLKAHLLYGTDHNACVLTCGMAIAANR